MKKIIIIGMAAAGLALTGCGSGEADAAAADIDAAKQLCEAAAMANMGGYTSPTTSNVEAEKGSLGFYVVDGQMDGILPSGESTTRYFKCDPAEGDTVSAEWSNTSYRPQSGSATSPASSPTTSSAASTTIRRGELLPEDRAFLSTLDSYWTDSVPNADLIEAGTTICEKLNSGASKTAVLQAVIPDSGPADNGINLLHASVVAYCPAHLTGIK